MFVALQWSEHGTVAPILPSSYPVRTLSDTAADANLCCWGTINKRVRTNRPIRRSISLT